MSTHMFSSRNKTWNNNTLPLSYLGQITLSKRDEIWPLTFPKQMSTISMHIAGLVKIHWYLPKLSSVNENLDVLLADNSVKNWWNLPISMPKPDLHNINAQTKFCGNPLTLDCHPETKIWTFRRQITLSKINEICPLTIPNQISTISMHIPSMLKIHWYLLKLSSRNENMDVLQEDNCQKLKKSAH